jgi:hypothetical protein
LAAPPPPGPPPSICQSAESKYFFSFLTPT